MPAHPALAAHGFGSDVRLTQAQSNANPAPGDPTIVAPDAPTAAPTPLERSRSRSLNKSVRQIGLVEPVDVEGIRPANIAAELQPATSPILLSGSPFGVAHPQRYLYCFSYNPLYFEDANLERCGLGHGFCQPAASAAQFLGRTALLPYSLIAHSPCSCETTLGDCPTCHAYPWGAEVHR
jgi:hypothetical protein